MKLPARVDSPEWAAAGQRPAAPACAGPGPRSLQALPELQGLHPQPSCWAAPSAPQQVIALREGGRLGAQAAANATEWGFGTRFGPRDSYQRYACPYI